MADDDSGSTSTLPSGGSIWPSTTPASVTEDAPQVTGPEITAPQSNGPEITAPTPPPPSDEPSTAVKLADSAMDIIGGGSDGQGGKETPEGPAKDIVDLMVGITPGRVMNTFIPMAFNAYRETWDVAVEGTKKGVRDLFASKPADGETPSSRESAAALPPAGPRGRGNPSRTA